MRPPDREQPPTGDVARLRALFHALVDLDPPERSAAFDRLCPAGDPLRAELEALLRVEVDDFLAPPAGFPGLSSGPSFQRSSERLPGMGKDGFLATDHGGARVFGAMLPVAGDELRIVERARRVAPRLLRLSHRSIATVREIGLTESELGEACLYALCELPGGFLPIEQQGATPFLTPHGLRDLVPNALEALAHAHREGLVDGGPDGPTVWANRAGEVRLMAFGLRAVVAGDDGDRLEARNDESLRAEAALSAFVRRHEP